MEEARRAQIDMMNKMIERERVWAQEKQDLLVTKVSHLEVFILSVPNL